MNKRIVILYVLLFLFIFFIKRCSEAYETININDKIIKYIKNINNNLTEKEYEEIVNSILLESSYYNLHWAIILTFIEIESNFNSKALSNVGAKGLMQIYSLECFNIKADESRLFEIRYNISFGLCIFQNKLKITNNDYIKAIELYNGSGSEARKYVIKFLHTLNKINKYFKII